MIGTPNDSDLLGDLYVTDPSNDLQFLKRRKRSRVDGTCEWILTTPQLVNWLNSPRNSSIETTSRILWIQGNPGQGKTTLAMYITEALTKSFSADASRSLGYFFCDTSYANRANANAILRGLLWQFYTSNPELIPAYARQRYGQLKEKLFRDFDSLWTLFLETARANSTRQLFCIIDALDECGDESRDDLLDQLEQTFETSDGPPNIHFLLLSRPYVHIRDLLGQFKSLDLASLPQIKEDVQQYIEYELEKLAKKKRYSTALKEKVKTVLVEKAEDTFLWVGMTCRELQSVLSMDVLKFLSRLPISLEVLYSRILTSLISPDAPGAADTKKILSLVSTSLRPLTLLELSEACYFDMENDHETRLQSMRDRIDKCFLLVDITTERRRSFDSQDDLNKSTQLNHERVVLLHSTVKEFLLTSSGLFNSSEQEIHTAAARRCIVELISHYGRHKSRSCSHRHFVRYASTYWHQHARLAQSAFIITDEIATFFSDPSPVRDKWLEDHLSRDEEPRIGLLWQSPSKNLPLLNVAAIWGIPSLINFAFQKSRQDIGINVEQYEDDDFGGSLKSPVSDAIGGGCVETLARLLEFGVPLTAFSMRSASQVGGEILSTILKARRDEIVMTPRLLQSAAAHFTPGNMLSLITHPNFKVTASTLRSTMVNVHHGHEILALLGDRPEIREFFDQSLLEIAITDSSKDMVTYLLDRLGNTLIVTATMIIQASTNWKFGLEIAEMLLDRFPNDIHITDDIILSIMDVNSGDSTDSSKVHDVLQLLFKRVGPEFRVTERLLLGAARSEFEEGDEAVVFRLVLSRFSDTLPIPDDVIMAAAKNSNAWAAMPLLLRRRNPEIRITEEILCAAIPNMDSYSSLLRNAARHSLRITEKAIETAAKVSEREGFLQILNAADTIRIYLGYSSCCCQQ